MGYVPKRLFEDEAGLERVQPPSLDARIVNYRIDERRCR